MDNKLNIIYTIYTILIVLGLFSAGMLLAIGMIFQSGLYVSFFLSDLLFCMIIIQSFQFQISELTDKKR